MAGSGSRKTAEDIKNIDMMTVRNKTQQEVTDVIFPNGLTVGLNDPRFNNGMRINGNMQCNGAVNATGPNASFRINGVPMPTEAIKGAPGIDGIDGLKGLDGAKGDIGVKGDQGPKGIPGAKGEVGVKGDIGVKGQIGVKGGVGAKGEIGVKGTFGFKGEPGVTPEPAAKGEPGVSVKGVPGESGPKGERGEPPVGIFGYADPSVFVYDEDGLNPTPETSTVTFTIMTTGIIIIDCALDDPYMAVSSTAGYTGLTSFVDMSEDGDERHFSRSITITAPESYPGPTITVTGRAADGNQTEVTRTEVTIACIKNGAKGDKGVKGQKGQKGVGVSIKGEKGAPGTDATASGAQFELSGRAFIDDGNTEGIAGFSGGQGTNNTLQSGFLPGNMASTNGHGTNGSGFSTSNDIMNSLFGSTSGVTLNDMYSGYTVGRFPLGRSTVFSKGQTKAGRSGEGLPSAIAGGFNDRLVTTASINTFPVANTGTELAQAVFHIPAAPISITSFDASINMNHNNMHSADVFFIQLYKTRYSFNNWSNGSSAAANGSNELLLVASTGIMMNGVQSISTTNTSAVDGAAQSVTAYNGAETVGEGQGLVIRFCYEKDAAHKAHVSPSNFKINLLDFTVRYTLL